MFQVGDDDTDMLFSFCRLAFMVAFGFSLANTLRAARGEYEVIGSGKIEIGKGLDLE